MTGRNSPAGRRAREAAVWQELRALVLERYDRRRAVADELGMSFLRVKALRQVAAGPLTMRELAAALGTDASYTTLVVDGLESRGLVVRTPRADDRRVKQVEATADGRREARRADRILASPPAPLRALADRDLAALERVIAELVRLSDDAPRAAAGRVRGSRPSRDG